MCHIERNVTERVLLKIIQEIIHPTPHVVVVHAKIAVSFNIQRVEEHTAFDTSSLCYYI